MKNKFKKHGRLLAFASLLLAAVRTHSVSSAKLAARHEYKLKLAMAEHVTFSANQSHVFIIPRTGYYAFQLRGGNGGDSQRTWPLGGEVLPLGGEGGTVSAISHFTEGTTLIITVGTKGNVNNGGFNGGGYGESDFSGFVNSYRGGGGGGATDVRTAGNTLEDRILVAGGGGGGSGGDFWALPPSGGGGGGNGHNEGLDGHGQGQGGGGGMAAGGDGANFGSLGQGGNGNHSGGGGGGGYFGGGGSYGSSGGGGGGSSYIGSPFFSGRPVNLPDITTFMLENSANTQNGYAVVTFLGSQQPGDVTAGE